jgi:hypothetical protein
VTKKILIAALFAVGLTASLGQAARYLPIPDCNPCGPDYMPEPSSDLVTANR